MNRKKQKSNKKPFFRFIKSIVKIFKKKPTFIIKNGFYDKPCIYIANHAAASGPTTYELYLPINFQMMGAYQMCGTIKQRWKYLANVYFYQKRNVPKWLSVILATIVVPFMIGFYKGMQIIPIFTGLKFKKTIEQAINTIEKNISVLLFPEDSFDGYHLKLKKCFGGFWMLAKEYYLATGKDIDIVYMYYHKKLNKIVVSEPVSYLEISQTINTNKEAADYFLEKINSLYESLL